MSTKDTRREFDRIVGRLAADDPKFSAPRELTRQLLTVLAVVGGLVWAGLSVLMVIWGAVGVIITCVAVAAFALGVARWHRRI
jgi:fatty acid desaturase